MNWFLIALIYPIAHAIINHFDKYLISRFMKNASVGVLIIFSSLFAVVALPILFILSPDVLTSVTLSQALILMINGAMLMVAVLFYLYALEHEEASYVAPLFQLIPVFGFIFGYFILGEVLHANQIRAAGLIVLGSIILSLNFGVGKSKVKSKLILLMLGSSLFYSINAVIFKPIAVERGFIDSLFWDMLGKVIFGLFLLLAVASYRQQFLGLLKSTHLKLIGLNVVNEVIGLVGEIAVVLAALFAPVALVQSVGGLQPAFVFIIGLIITLFFPRLGKESLAPKALAQKIAGIIIITAGIYLLEFK